MSTTKPSGAPRVARAARSRGSAASVRCAANTTRRMRRARRPARSRSGFPAKPCRAPCAVFPVSRTAWNRSDAAAHALSSFADIFWIAGGKPKLGGITSLAEYFPRIRKAYLIGEAAHEFAATLGTQAPHEISETLDVAVTNAARDAEASGLADAVVLLSPACASFDQYRNFEIRGAAFREAVLKLDGVSPVT